MLDNSISKRLPCLVKEWDFEKNGELSPDEVLWQSSKKIWWLCERKHSFCVPPCNRIRFKKQTKEIYVSPCPYCSGKRVLCGVNDLATTNPELIKEWDFKKNAIKPSEVTFGSHNKVWWLCDKGHSWQAVIYSRKQRGCPYCAGKAVLSGFNDLETLNYELAKQWHPTKNNGIKPNEVSLNSHKKYWWICDKGHEWEIHPHNRNYGSDCPYCYGRFAIKGETDLVTLIPELAKEWHPAKNKGTSPYEVTVTSHKKVWWLCKQNHEWQAYVYSRASGRGCPYCSGFKPIIGETDLATLAPEIAEEWNYEKNKGKTPDMFTKNSNKKVWWKCRLGHEWRTIINNRTSIGTGCPRCAKSRNLL